MRAKVIAFTNPRDRQRHLLLAGKRRQGIYRSGVGIGILLPMMSINESQIN